MPVKSRTASRRSMNRYRSSKRRVMNGRRSRTNKHRMNGHRKFKGGWQPPPLLGGGMRGGWGDNGGTMHAVGI